MDYEGSTSPVSNVTTLGHTLTIDPQTTQPKNVTFLWEGKQVGRIFRNDAGEVVFEGDRAQSAEALFGYFLGCAVGATEFTVKFEDGWFGA